MMNLVPDTVFGNDRCLTGQHLHVVGRLGAPALGVSVELRTA